MPNLPLRKQTELQFSTGITSERMGHNIMNTDTLKLTGFILAATLLGSGGCAENMAPETVYTNGFIYTVNPALPTAEALAVRDGQIIAVGSAQDVEALAAEQTRVVDLEGRMLMPGIHDMHAHPMEAGEKYNFQCAFPFTFTMAEIVAQLTECAANTPPGEWIRGGQWAMELMETDTVPHKDILDAITREHPIYLGDSTVHAAWLNSRGLAEMGIDATTPDPQGGVIIREPGSAEPTGVLVDNAAYNILSELPAYSDEQYQQALAWSMHEMNKVGVTAIKDALSGRHALKAYKGLDDSGRLTMKVSVSIAWKMFWTDYEKNITERADFATQNVGTEFAKIMLDGIPPTRTAAMLDPYLPDDKHGANFTGKLIHAPEILTEDMIHLDAQGLTVKVHATGDRAVRVTLDAVEAARKANGDSGMMHEISHAELIHPDDIPRFGELNVIAEFSPILWYPSQLVQVMSGIIGAERANRFWPTKSLLDAGAHIIYGSDWPSVVPDPNPWPGIEAMVTRRDPYGVYPGALWAEQAIDLETALRIFTIDGAVAGKHSDRTGTIEVGKSADFIVLDRNLFDIPVEEISETQVLLTVVSGREVYSSAQQ